MGLNSIVNLIEFAYVVCLCLLLYSVFAIRSVILYLFCIVCMYICLKIIRKRSTTTLELKHQGIIITGCDTGFGHDLAQRLDAAKITVFAGCLNPDGAGAIRLKESCSKKLHIVPLDVSSDDSVDKAHNYIVKHLPENGLWAIVNNAGFNVMGDVELLTIDLYKKVMGVNYLGAIRIFRNFLYLVRRNKGRVVIVSSVKGRYSWPENSAYHVTKHGLETVADALRLEMFRFGVNVSVIEPGNFSMATACQTEEHFQRYKQEADDMWDHASEDVRKTYGRKYLDAMLLRQRRSIGGSALSTKPVIDALEDALLSGRPHTRYVVDGGTWWDPYTTLARYYYYFPTWLTDFIITKMTGCNTFPDYSKLNQ